MGIDDYELVVTPNEQLEPDAPRLRERMVAALPENVRLVREVPEDNGPWAMILEIRHLDAFEKARLAAEFTMSVLDDRTGDLVVVPPTNPQAVAALLAAEWLCADEAVLTGRRA